MYIISGKRAEKEIFEKNEITETE